MDQKCEVILGYIVNLRLAWATREPVNHKTKLFKVVRLFLSL